MDGGWYKEISDCVDGHWHEIMGDCVAEEMDDWIEVGMRTLGDCVIMEFCLN